MLKGYTSRQAIENYLLIEIDSSFNSQVDTWISEIERFIDEYTGRNFIADSSATARLFNGNDKNELEIDDCIAVTKVELGTDDYGTSFTETTGYVLLPANAIVKDQPIKAIHLKSEYFNIGLQNHRITAKWGYSEECPGDIATAATILVVHLYKFGRGGITGGIAQEKIGNYSVVYKDEKDKGEYETALSILNKYKRHYL
jgi:hypothetical protein